MDIEACKKLGGEWNPRTNRCKAFDTYVITVDELILYRNDKILKSFNMDDVVDIFLDKEGLEIF